MPFLPVKKSKKKNVLVLCFFHIIFKDSAFTDVKGMQKSNLGYVKGVLYVNRK